MNIIHNLTILACGAALTLSSLAVTPEDVEKKAGEVIIPEIQFRDLDVAVALKVISKETGIKVFYNPPKDDPTRITLSLKNVPASEALKYVTGLANLKFIYKEDGVHVTPK